MSERRAQIILLCEDSRHRSLFLGLLRKHLKCQNIRVNMAPPGKGAGEQHVRENYPKEVKLVRVKNVSRFLVTVMDADTYSVAHHYNELNSELRKDKQKIRQKNDPIAIFIPKHNIETWFYCLNAETSVSETDDFKQKVANIDCTKIVKEFYRLSLLPTAKLPDYCPDSLKLALPEVGRLRSPTAKG